MTQTIITDETIEKLEEELNKLQSRPDKRRRWTRQLIERLRVSELAAAIICDEHLPASRCEEIWTQAQTDAIVELRKQGRIR